MSGINSTYQPPDLDDVKESVKQGVTKVAGKLSSLANGMMSSFQVLIKITYSFNYYNMCLAILVTAVRMKV